MSDKLFSAYKLGDIILKNRIVMAPLTRNRASEGNVPTELNAKYYQQRASAGLIITEASQVSAAGIGYPATPGIHSDAQVQGWRKVTDAVHDAGGIIFIQLWYCGRISHPSLLPDNQQPVAPSAIKPDGEAYTYDGMQPFVEPRALQSSEIPNIVAQYQHAARQAQQAGFDGIEIHAANGYLIDQFLRDGSNHRDDEYGGNVENRMRFLNEIITSVFEVWSPNRVGVRLSPENAFNSISDSDPQQHFSYFMDQLNDRNLAYIHMVEGDMLSGQSMVDYSALRKLYSGTYVANRGYDRERALSVVESGQADLVAFGIPYIANPDLVKRLQTNSSLNEADQATFYGGGAEGYIDYKFLSD